MEGPKRLMELSPGAGYNYPMNNIPALPKVFWSFVTLSLLTGVVNAQKLGSDNDCLRGFGSRMEGVHKLTADFSAEQKGKAVAASRAAAAAAREAVATGRIHSTLVTMRDAVGVGQKIADFIERSPNISVEFDNITGISSHDEIGGSMPAVTLRINKDLPRSERILSVPIANEAFDMMYEQMPESAEKAYMHASVVTRAWLEIGNSAETLPVIDPLLPAYRNAEIEAILRSWVFKSPSQAIQDIGAAKNLLSLQELLARNEAEIRHLEPAEAEYNDYMNRTHKADPTLEPDMRRMRNARERQVYLEKGLEMYIEFRVGVDYKDAQGKVRNNHEGEDAWRLMNAGMRKF